MIMRYIKKDLETFDYNKSYDIKSEHKWDFAKDDEKVKKYFDKIEEITKPKRGQVQANPEETGQKY